MRSLYRLLNRRWAFGRKPEMAKSFWIYNTIHRATARSSILYVFFDPRNITSILHLTPNSNRLDNCRQNAGILSCDWSNFECPERYSDSGAARSLQGKKEKEKNKPRKKSIMAAYEASPSKAVNSRLEKLRNSNSRLLIHSLTRRVLTRLELGHLAELAANFTSIVKRRCSS